MSFDPRGCHSNDPIDRAIYMMEVAAAYLDEHGYGDTIKYDDADCDEGCIADDLRCAAEELRSLLPRTPRKER